MMFEAIDTKTDTLRRCGRDRLERREALTSLKRALDAEWTFQEMAVSGTPLARMDVRRMIEIKNEPRPGARVLREAYNFCKAAQFIERYVSRAPRELTETELTDAHGLLVRGLGTARSTNGYRAAAPVQSDAGHAAPTDEVEGAMDELFAWLRSSTHQHPVRQATELQLRLLYCQPFEAMNGRLARLLSSLVLMQRGLPPALLNGDDRQPYLDAIGRAPKDGGWALARLLGNAVERSLDFCLDTVERMPVFAHAR